MASRQGERAQHHLLNKHFDLFCFQFLKFYLFLFMYLFCFLGPHLWHMEVPRLGVKSELELLACTTATATQDLSHVWDLHHSSWQCWIPDPLARDQICVLMHASQICFCCTTTGTPTLTYFKWSALLSLTCCPFNPVSEIRSRVGRGVSVRN